MIWQENVIALNSTIAASNTVAQTYNVDFLAGPAVYQLGTQQTTAYSLRFFVLETVYS